MKLTQRVSDLCEVVLGHGLCPSGLHAHGLVITLILL
jgi:hypothetical protein